MDGDGFPDIVLAFYYSGVYWVSNVDGVGGFSTATAIATDTDDVSSVTLADLDGDGDLDVISTTSGDGKSLYSRMQISFVFQKHLYLS